jgi:hypothetical protein
MAEESQLNHRAKTERRDPSQRKGRAAQDDKLIFNLAQQTNLAL